MVENDSQSVAGKWHGQYTYGYSHQLRDFSFSLEQTENGDYKGRMFDDKHLDMGDIVGGVARSVLVIRRHSTDKSWLRVYEPIEFQAKISADGNRLTGNWKNTNNGGSWKAERVAGPPSEAGLQKGEADFDQVAGVTNVPFASPASAGNVSADLSLGADDDQSAAPQSSGLSGGMSGVNTSPIDQFMAGDSSKSDRPVFQYAPSDTASSDIFPSTAGSNPPPIPSVFSTAPDRSNAPSISTDTISSDSVKSLNIDVPDPSSIDLPILSSIASPPSPTGTLPDLFPKEPTSAAPAPSGSAQVCSRCGAPKGDFSFCLSCGHSFELSQ